MTAAAAINIQRDNKPYNSIVVYTDIEFYEGLLVLQFIHFDG